MRPFKQGTVYLVGGGPGDPELLTLRAQRLMAEADVVVHDALITPGILAMIRPGAALIDMGKRAGRPGASQAFINHRLISLAKKGFTVLRLKGGDSFIFGRGGEEALALARAGIPFQIVPGITSALAVPASAGIPLTHRGLSTSVTLTTASREKGRLGESDPDSHSDKGSGIGMIGGPKRGTEVILMGVARMAAVLEGLVKQGRDPGTPAAAVSWGTTALQKTVLATVGTLAAKARREGLAAPAVIVVGQAVALRRKLAWFEKLPLFGRTVLVTRSQRRAGRLASLLKDKGAEVLSFPLLETKALRLSAEDKALLARPGRFDLIAFSSPEAIRVFFETLSAGGLDARALAGCKIAVVGPGTAAELAEHGLKADYEAARHFRAEGLLKFLPPLKGKEVLLPRALKAREVLAQGLRLAGAQVRALALYDTVLPKTSRRDVLRLRELLKAGRVSAITFTSSSSVSNLVQALGPGGKALACKARLVSIGPSTSASLREAGLRVDGEARQSRVEDLAEAVVRSLKRKR